MTPRTPRCDQRAPSADIQPARGGAPGVRVTPGYHLSNRAVARAFDGAKTGLPVPAAVVQRLLNTGGSGISNAALSLLLRSQTGEQRESDAVPSIVGEVLQRSGQPLDAGVRADKDGNSTYAASTRSVQRQAVVGRSAGAEELRTRMGKGAASAERIAAALEQLEGSLPADRTQPVEVVIIPYTPVTVASYEVPDLLSDARRMAGRPRLQVVEADGIPFIVTVPSDAGPASGQVDASQAQKALLRNNVAVISAKQIEAAAQYLTVRSGDQQHPGGPAAGALPTGNTIQWLAGRFYPFARPLTPTELTQISGQRIVHLTASTNLEGPTGIRAVGLQPSRGFFVNMTDPQLRNNIWTFIGEPTSNQVGLNLAGRGGRAAQAAVVIEGANLPEGALFRPIDRALMIPGSYNGDRIYFGAGEPVPLPPEALRGPVGPTEALPPNLRSELARSGAFSGHPLAAGITSGVLVVALDTGLHVFTQGELPPPGHVADLAIAGGTGGVSGAAAEQATARALAIALNQSSGRLIVLGRAASSGVGGAVAGPIVETMRLALDEREHTGGEYAAAAGRGAVAGAAGGLMGAATAGALAGSVAPGVGNAIGFVVGAATYMVVNWLLE